MKKIVTGLIPLLIFEAYFYILFAVLGELNTTQVIALIIGFVVAIIVELYWLIKKGKSFFRNN